MATTRSAAREREALMSPPRASAAASQDAPRTPNFADCQQYSGASASPRTPWTRSAVRGLNDSSSLAYQTPDLDSIIMNETAFSQVYDYRSPMAAKDELVRHERGLNLFSPGDSRARLAPPHCAQPGLQSPTWPFSSPSLATFRLPTPEYPPSPNTHMLYQFGLRREHLARPLLHDAMIMPQLPDAHFAGYPGAETKRARKERREKKSPTTSAPKRGEYRCGKCGFFPKKQKHNCAAEKQKRPAPAERPPTAAQFPAAEGPLMPHVYYG